MKEAMLKQQSKEKEKLTAFRTDVCNNYYSYFEIMYEWFILTSTFRFKRVLMTLKLTELEQNWNFLLMTEYIEQ